MSEEKYSFSEMRNVIAKYRSLEEEFKEVSLIKDTNERLCSTESLIEKLFKFKSGSLLEREVGKRAGLDEFDYYVYHMFLYWCCVDY